MKKRKYIIGLTTVAILTMSMGTAVFADEPSQTDIDAIQDIINEQSDKSLTMPELQQDQSTTDVNDQFEMLAASIVIGGLEGYTMPKFAEGYSSSITDLFQSTFGDMNASMEMHDFSIPEEFSLSNIMKNASNERNAFVSGFMDSALYQNTISQISIGSVMEMAKKGMNSGMPSMLSPDTMNAMLGGISASAKSKADSSLSAISNAVSNIEANNKSRVHMDGNMTKTYNEKLKTAKDWLDTSAKGLASSKMLNFGIRPKATLDGYVFHGNELMDEEIYNEVNQAANSGNITNGYFYDYVLKNAKTKEEAEKMINFANGEAPYWDIIAQGNKK